MPKPEHSWYNSTTKTRSVHKNSQLVIKVINIIPICVCKENLVPVHFTFVDGQEEPEHLRNLQIYKKYEVVHWSGTGGTWQNGGCQGERTTRSKGKTPAWIRSRCFSSLLLNVHGGGQNVFFIFSKNNYEYGQGTRWGEEGERYQGERAI